MELLTKEEDEKIREEQTKRHDPDVKHYMGCLIFFGNYNCHITCNHSVAIFCLFTSDMGRSDMINFKTIKPVILTIALIYLSYIFILIFIRGIDSGCETFLNILLLFIVGVTMSKIWKWSRMNRPL